MMVNAQVSCSQEAVNTRFVLNHSMSADEISPIGWQTHSCNAYAIIQDNALKHSCACTCSNVWTM